MIFVVIPARWLALSHAPQEDYNPLAELQKWVEIQRKEDASFASAGRRCLIAALFQIENNFSSFA